MINKYSSVPGQMLSRAAVRAFKKLPPSVRKALGEKGTMEKVLEVASNASKNVRDKLIVFRQDLINAPESRVRQVLADHMVNLQRTRARGEIAALSDVYAQRYVTQPNAARQGRRLLDFSRVVNTTETRPALFNVVMPATPRNVNPAATSLRTII